MNKRSQKWGRYNPHRQRYSAVRPKNGRNIAKKPRAQHRQQHASSFELPPSLDQLGPQAMPVLIPLTVTDSIDHVVEQVRTAGAAHVELLVPDGMSALRSLAGCELLYAAANEAGIGLTIYVADRQIARMARRVGLDVVNVDGQITVPAQDSWGQQTGATGVRRRGFSDEDWEAARRELDATIEGDPVPDDMTDDLASYPWPQPDTSFEQTPPPSLSEALLSRLPGRIPHVAPKPTIRRPPMHSAVIPRGVDKGQRQSSGSAWVPLLAICLALVVAGGLLWYSLGRDLPWRFGGAQTPVVIQAPLKELPPISLSDFAIPITSEPMNESSVAVRGLQLTTPVTVSIEGSASGITVTPVGHGQGKIALINRSPQPVTIPAGTPLQAGGQEFEFETDVFVPGLIERADLTGTDYGVAHAPLRARRPGLVGNIPAGTITEVPPELTAGIQLDVYQWESFSGGSTIEEPTVLSDDVKKVLPQAVEQLYDKGVGELQNEVAQYPDFAISDGTIKPTSEALKDLQAEDYKVSPPVGQVAKDGTFKLELSEMFEALAEPVDQPITQQLEQAVAKQVRQAEGVEVESVQIDGWRADGQTLIIDALVVPSPQVAEVSADLVAQIQAAIADQPRAEAEQYLEELKTSGAIEEFRLPPEWQVVPRNVQIDVVGPGMELGT